MNGSLSTRRHKDAISVISRREPGSVAAGRVPVPSAAQDVLAWTTYRQQLVAEHRQRWTDPSTPAFVGINRWGPGHRRHRPNSVTRAIKRISVRAQVPIVWTGHSLRSGLATEGRVLSQRSLTSLTEV
ncbi:hypothetical protein [Streptomyces sp900105755]|uniref:Integrase n=1 Tax=Streptomyces sp. 900105755 TaxID=3154389 RepID=A0ABV1TY85_9ACTN